MNPFRSARSLGGWLLPGYKHSAPISPDSVMSNLTPLRLAAREIFDETLRAVDAGEAVRGAVRLKDTRLSIRDTTIDLGNRSIYSIAIGKAAVPMALALESVLGGRLAGGLVAGAIANELSGPIGAMPPGKLTTRWRCFQGGHPFPNSTSLLAARDAFALLRRANGERALIIFLISGGGSAMIEWPISNDISLADLRAANQVLVNSGASISEINAVRRAFSAIKAGRLAAHAPDCDQITLIVSDVLPDDERNVASGPTLAPAEYGPQAQEVIARYDLAGRLPEAILRIAPAPPVKSDQIRNDSSQLREHFVLLDNNSALEAAATAAKRRGFVTEVARDVSDQAIEIGCEQMITRLEQLRRQKRDHSSKTLLCLISGGEFACPVRGDGLGGRNLETALRMAVDYQKRLTNEDQESNFVALCAGTDGIDGNSPAAGAIVDHTTIQRARAIGLDAEDFIKRSDAYSFFVALGDAIATGPTGTNVRDVRILLSSARDFVNVE